MNDVEMTFERDRPEGRGGALRRYVILVYAAIAYALALLATRFEEADLIEELGDRYRRYRERVPAFVPVRRPCSDGAASVGESGLR